MTDAMSAIRSILGMPEPVTLWRIVSRDPDRNAYREGVLIDDTKTEFVLRMDYCDEPHHFRKFDEFGSKVWRRVGASS